MNNIDKTLVADLVKRFGSPLYIFEEAKIRAQCKLLRSSVSYPNTIFRYACKALSNSSILKIIKEEGFLIDASSFNEVQRALRIGYKPTEILYTGEGADTSEFRRMLELGVDINCSSLDQLRLVGALKPGSKVSLRFNPGEGHGHHLKVNTGGPHSKHGIYFSDAELASTLAKSLGLSVSGIHTHIGSGTDLGHWLKIKDITLNIAKNFPDLEFVDLGGGFPVVYNKTSDTPMPIKEWGFELSKSLQAFSESLGKQIQLQLEPGRFLVADCGHLIAEVQSFKTTPENTFAVVNTGFNHNPRPVMYGAYHPIEFIQSGESSGKQQPYVIAGNLCESGDVFTVNDNDELAPRVFPELKIGDLMVMGMVGAYSYSMMSEYNSMSLPAAVLLCSDGSTRLIERRGTLEDLFRREV